MATSNIFKKLRRKITRSKRSYDVDPSGNNGTVVLRRVDPGLSGYRGSYNCEHFNVLCDFPPASNSPISSRFPGDVTLPRQFRGRNGHHRTQSNITVVDTDEIDLYNAIGDHHRRSSCSCTCTGPRKPIVVPIPVPPPHVPVISNNRQTPSPTGHRRDAAKDPLPTIDDMQKALQKEHERYKHEGKFATMQAEIPRYTEIDDYSTVDNFVVPITIQTEKVPFDVDRKFITLQQPEKKSVAAIPDRHAETSNPSHKEPGNDNVEYVKPKPSEIPLQHSQLNLPEKTGVTKHSDRDEKIELGQGAMGGECATVAVKKSVCNQSNWSSTEHDSERHDVIDGIHYGKEEVLVSVVESGKSLPTTEHARSHKSERTKSHNSEHVPQQVPGPYRSEGTYPLSASFPDAHPGSNKYGSEISGYHEYKEAHQVFRVSSGSKLVNLNDVEVSSSVEDLYAHVPRGATKTPDSENEESSDTSEPNTDNEDNFPPPPIPSRNYRQDAYGGKNCGVCRDGETGEDIVEDGGNDNVDEAVEDLVREPIHMTLEEVWMDACARGIPMEKPQASTLQRPQTRTSPTSSPLLPGETSPNRNQPEDFGTKRKEKMKIRNIFRKGEVDRLSQTPGQITAGRNGLCDSSSDDVNTSSDVTNTSGDTSSSLESGPSTHPSNSTRGGNEVSESQLQTKTSENTGTINADFIDSLRKLKDCGWYWGPLSWDGAESRLANKPDGSFLVRDSSDDRYILSISFRSQGTTHHSRIEHYKGTFSFYSQPKSHGAGTITEFIEKAMEHSRSGKFLYFLRPRAAGLPPAPVQLLYPVSRFRILQSLQHMCRFEILRTTRYDHIDKLPLPQKVKGYLKESQYYTEYILEERSSDLMAL